MLKTDIANLALNHIGVTTFISDIETDNSLEARVIRRWFKIALEDVLEMHMWSFATRTAALTVFSEDPEKNYKYAYNKPVDALVVRELAGEGYFLNPGVEHYRDEYAYFEERQSGSLTLLYTNVRNAHAKYTANVPENSNFRNYFGRSLAAHLSMVIGPSIITNNWPKVMNAINSMAYNNISEGIAEDIARSPQKNNALPPTIRARFQ